MNYGLIGARLGHSYSCELHRLLGSYAYELCELRPDSITKFLERRAFKAVNVTIPYKQAVIPHLDWLSDTAGRIGAVNTIVNRGGRLYGYNTDYAGLCSALSHMGLTIQGRKLLILGTGGTAATAQAAANALGAGRVTLVAARSPTKLPCRISPIHRTSSTLPRRECTRRFAKRRFTCPPSQNLRG